MIASSVITLLLLSVPLSFGGRLLIITFGSALIWIAVTILTRPAPMEVLAEFYRRTRPVGIWGAVRQWSRAHGQITPHATGMTRPLAGWLWGMALVLGLTLAIGYAVFLRPLPAAIWFTVSIIGAIGLYKAGFLKTR
jgi:hypothetical protein